MPAWMRGSGIVLPGALDDHTDIRRAANRTMLVDGETQPLDAEVVDHFSRYLLGERFDEIEFRLRYKGDHALRNGFVVKRVADVIAGRGLADVAVDFQID